MRLPGGAVMPAMNAAKTLERTVGAIPRDFVDEVILVDDHSTDETRELARSLPIHLVWHPHNAGYGANQKTCYLEALQREADRQARGEDVIASQFEEDRAVGAEAIADLLEGGAGQQAPEPEEV
jgi:glycosyltransferase involved in cell wall biosynthesis